MQRKKKPGVHQSQKIVAAQYRNEFYRKLEWAIVTCCGKDVFRKIPKSELDKVYTYRNTPFRFKIAPGSEVPNDVYSTLKNVLPRLLKNSDLADLPNGLKISIFDHYTVIRTIFNMTLYFKDQLFEGAKEVREALEQIARDPRYDQAACTALYDIIMVAGMLESRMDKLFYWLRSDMKIPERFPGEIVNIIEIESLRTGTRPVTIDGNVRPAYRVGWGIPISGMSWVQIKPSVLKIKGSSSDVPLDVYVQSHALRRLEERVDCFWPSMVHYNMFLSLLDPRVFRDKYNNILVEFRFWGNKAGYFPVSVVDGVILVRTFLFVTNNGTPEGQLLEKQTGLQKLDKKYLAIDKLSTFMTSDIDQNPGVQKIFRSAGCGCLVDLYENSKPLLSKKTDSFDSNALLSYLSYFQGNATQVGEVMPEVMLEEA